MGVRKINSFLQPCFWYANFTLINSTHDNWDSFSKGLCVCLCGLGVTIDKNCGWVCAFPSGCATPPLTEYSSFRIRTLDGHQIHQIHIQFEARVLQSYVGRHCLYYSSIYIKFFYVNSNKYILLHPAAVCLVFFM